LIDEGRDRAAAIARVGRPAGEHRREGAQAGGLEEPVTRPEGAKDRLHRDAGALRDGGKGACDERPFAAEGDRRVEDAGARLLGLLGPRSHGVGARRGFHVTPH